MVNGPAYQNLHQEYIDKCRKGDKKAQYEIYRLYYRAMYNTSLRILGDRQEAEDIMQESFLSAFLKINAYSGKVSFGAWLRKIVINKSLDALKKRKIRFDELEEDIDEKQLLQEEQDEDFSHVKIEMIRQAIEKLPDGYRVILILHLFEGYDHEEIAEILNIRSSTSRSQFTRAKQKLLELLSDKK